MKTVELDNLIRESEVFDEKVILKNQGGGFPEMIEKLLEEKGINRAELIRSLNVDRNYGYQILNGIRKPTRRQIVQMGLYFGLDCDRLNKLLTLCDRSVLYARRPEDARILYCLEHKMEYGKACEFIWENVEQ